MLLVEHLRSKNFYQVSDLTVASHQSVYLVKEKKDGQFWAKVEPGVLNGLSNPY